MITSTTADAALMEATEVRILATLGSRTHIRRSEAGPAGGRIQERTDGQ